MRATRASVDNSPQETFTTTNITVDPNPTAPQTFTASSGGTTSVAGEWRDRMMYFPLTDRFCNGDPNNDQGVRPDVANGFHGGDLRGLDGKLDYIKELGAGTLWLAPILKNTYDYHFGDYHGYGFHGYWINDHEQVEPRQGTLEDAQDVVKHAHEKGMRVVLDTVLNHTGIDHPFASDPSKKDWFHHNGNIVNYDDQHQVENHDLGGLPDFNQSNPETYEYLLNNTVEWVQKLGVDGVRLDAVKHIDKDFWSKFTHDLKERVGDPDFFVLGEVLHGDPAVVADYQRAGLDYLFDIPLYYTIRDVFGNDASARKLGERLAEDSKYVDANKLVTLLDNHDFPRFISTAQGDFQQRVDRLELAGAFLNSVRGIPSVYYGTEVALEGGDDPDNRRDMEFDRHPEVRQYFTKLSDIRNGCEPLRRGDQREMWQDDQVYAFSRRTDREEAICVFNTADQAQSRTIPLRIDSHMENGNVLVDLLSGQEVSVQDGKIHLEMGGKTPKILVKKP